MVALALAAQWLRLGGSVIAVPLQYANIRDVADAMLELYNIDLADYRRKFAYIQFDLAVDITEKNSDDTVNANLLKPEAWDAALTKAEELITKSDQGTLVLSTALNLLLFSPTYREALLEKLKTLLSQDRSRTHICTVSTSVFENDIESLEEASDNVLSVRMQRPMNLYLTINRMRNVSFVKDEQRVPIESSVLKKMKQEAERTRTQLIPKLKKI
ncbi:MAG TPA: hypothetical protein ENN56_01530 [Firmicutes bacterium]|nr:hypothetical protein [Bacillota bacterium]